MSVEDTRNQILRAAAECIAENGVRGLRVNDVTKHAGVSSGLLYYHFTNRSGLLEATLAYVNEYATANGINTRVDADNARATLVAKLVDEISDAPHVRDNSIAWNEIRASAVFDDELARQLAHTTRQWCSSIARTTRQAQGEALANVAIEPDDFAVIATALVEGLSSRWLSGQLTTDEARRLLTEVLESQLDPSPETNERPSHASN